MSDISSKKIGKRAVDYLRRIISQHNTMDHSFNEDDTHEIWDGYIILPKNDTGDVSKRNFEARIPVQIKGHDDQEHSYFDKTKISHKVDLCDLNGFGSEKGGVYFIVYTDGKGNGQIFYASLYPSLVLEYIERCGNQKSIHIPFYRLEGNPDDLYKLAKQFNLEASKQGSVHTPLVKDRINITDIKDLKEMNFEVYGNRSMSDIVKGLSDRSICLYGKEKDDKYPRPIQLNQNSFFALGRDVKQTISVDGEDYYNSYETIEEAGILSTVRLSENLIIEFKKSRILFEYKTTIKQLYNDARFLLSLIDGKKMKINGTVVDLGTIEENSDFKQKLDYIVDLYETLEMIGVEIDSAYSDLSQKQKNDIFALLNYKRGNSDKTIPEGISTIIWNYDGKKVPLFVIKDKEKVLLENAAYPKKRVIGISNSNDSGEENKIYRVPAFMHLHESILSNLYEYNYDEFEKQIELMECNDKTFDFVLGAALKMINVYDITNDNKFLDYADNLVDELMILKDEDYLVLNKMQIKKRRGELSESDAEIIERIEEKDIYIGFGKNVLLEDRIKAQECFEEFSTEEKERYEKYPIFRLFREI